MAYIKDKYDIGITNTDSSIVGMMLVQDKNNCPLYSEFDDEYLAEQYFTGDAGYGGLPAEKELAIRQDSWRSGISDDIYNSDRPEGYYRSKGMDMRFGGMGIAGWTPTTVITPAEVNVTDSIADANMEVGTGWLAGTANPSEQTSRYAHGGIYSRACNYVGADQWDYQDLPWSNTHRGRTFILNGWAWHNIFLSINVSRIGLDDGVTTSWSANSVVNFAWDELSVSKTLASNATRLRIQFGKFHPNTSNYYFDDFTIKPDVAVNKAVALAEYNDKLYLARGRFLSSLNTNGALFDHILTTAVNITDLEPFPDDNLYICLNYHTAMLANEAGYAMNVSEGFTPLGAVANGFQFMMTVHSAVPTMWGNSTQNGIRSNNDPINALAWSGLTSVGSTYYNITDLISKAGALYIMKEDTPYYLDSTGAVKNDLAPELRSLLANTSGKNVCLWKNNLYIPCGEQGLLETDGTTNRFLNPASYCTNLTDYTGRVMAVVSDEQYLFVAVKNGSQAEILAGREETIGNTTDWIWHPIAELTLSGVETMYVSTIIQKRLWIASTDASEPLYYIPLPIGYGDITNDTNRAFLSNTFFETPFLHGNFKDTDKAFPELSVLMGHSYDTDIFFQAYYKTLSNSTYTFIANYKGSATSMLQTNYLPNAGANHPVDQMIRLKFIANTDDSLKTPKLLSYHLKGLLYPPKRTIIACTVKCSNELPTKDGTIDRGSFNTVKATIDESVKAPWPVTFYDIDGNTRYVKLLPLPSTTSRWTLHKQEKNRVEERWYNLLMQEVDLS